MKPAKRLLKKKDIALVINAFLVPIIMFPDK